MSDSGMLVLQLVPFLSEIFLLCSGGLEGRGAKTNQLKKQGKKRDSIRSRNSKKMAQEIR
ncbi:MAG: hypothetical protein ACMUEL_07820 [Flavobacteriales bacterium Tduv]